MCLCKPGWVESSVKEEMLKARTFWLKFLSFAGAGVLFLFISLLFISIKGNYPVVEAREVCPGPSAPVEGQPSVSLEETGARSGLPDSCSGSIPVTAPDIYGRVLLLFMDRLSVEELFDLAGPRLQELIEEGSPGLMNSRTAGGGDACGYLTLGAASRATGKGEKGGSAFERGEIYRQVPAEEVYRRYHGGESPPGAILHPYYYYLLKENDKLEYTVKPGALGEALRLSGHKTAVVGNADTESSGAFRPAVLTVMDGRGAVDLGVTGGELVQQNPSFPGGSRTSGADMAKAVNEAAREASLVAVEWGDTTRQDEERPYMSPSAVEHSLEKTFREVEVFLENLEYAPGEKTLFILAVPSPPRHGGGSGETLLPVLFTGGGFGGGYPVSATTRREGVIANLDVAVTVLDFLEVPRLRGMGGAPVQVCSGEEGEGMPGVEGCTGDQAGEKVKEKEIALTALQCRLTALHEQRSLFLSPYVTGQILLLLGGVAAVALPFTFLRRLWAVLLEASLLLPLSFLVLALFPGFQDISPWWSLLFLLLAAAGVLACLHPLKKKKDGRLLFWSALALLIALPLIADLFSGARLQMFSYLGYDLVSGARYYGLGNEYMGVLLGSGVLGAASIWGYFSCRGNYARCREGSCRDERANRLNVYHLFALVLPAALLLAVVLVTASPRLGANAGGAAATAVAGGIMILHLVRENDKTIRRPRWKPLLAAGIFLLVPAAFWLYHFNVDGGEAWHLQGFWDHLTRGDLEEVRQILQRKLSMNLKLIRYSVWSRVLIAVLMVLGITFFYPVGVIKKFREKQAPLYYGLTSVVGGGMAALLLNDSGVVAAATAHLYGVVPLLVYSLEEAESRRWETGGG